MLVAIYARLANEDRAESNRHGVRQSPASRRH